MSQSYLRASRFLAYVLRHDPDKIGISLTDEGWASVSEVLVGLRQHGHQVTRDILVQIVQEDDKGRYSLSLDGRRIRANHGHSVPVVLGAPTDPPDLLYHGTAWHKLDSIKQNGLERRSRQYVHLSGTVEQARLVGERHGSPVVIPVQSGVMHVEGFKFWHTASDVWLTAEVPVSFIRFAELVH